jgi:hypothetical protein
MTRIGVLALVLTVCSGCATSGAGTPAGVPLDTLDRGTDSAIRQRSFIVARTAEEVAALWQAHRGTSAPPAVAGRTVIGVFAGMRPTGGYRIDVERAEIRGGRVHVHVRDTAPAPGTLVTQSLTYPYHLVAIPPTDMPIEFIQVAP